MNEGEVNNYCRFCRNYTSTVTVERVNDDPRKILVVELARPVDDEGNLVGEVVRCNETLDARPLMLGNDLADPVWYNLYAAILHKGGNVKNDEYLAYAKQLSGAWRCLNDDGENPLDATTMDENACCLFYEKFSI